MSTGPASLLEYLYRLAPDAAGDAVLLDRFARHGDEAAFAALLARHGPLVYQRPLIRCGREGRGQEEAARILGWSPGSLKGRLERGRRELHARLRRRGLGLAVGLLTLGMGKEAAAVPAALAAATVRAAA